MNRIRGWYYESGDDVPDRADLEREEEQVKSRSWFYQDEPASLNLEELYRTCYGTVFVRQDCGTDACGSANCCHSTGPDSYIFFLPGELEHQLTLQPSIPFAQVDPDHPERRHCAGSDGCIYQQRPLDCRSYPYFPAVRNGQHEGYFDCRGSHDCPLTDFELRGHLWHIHSWWRHLLSRREIRDWAEQHGRGLRLFPVAPVPDAEEA